MVVILALESIGNAEENSRQKKKYKTHTLSHHHIFLHDTFLAQ